MTLVAPHAILRLDSGRYHGGDRKWTDPDMIVMHSTADAGSASQVMAWMNHPDRERENHKTSYHYLIDRNGTVTRMLPITTIAYHAGDSAWPSPVHYPPGNGGRSVNKRSIGISFCNRNDGREPLTQAQLDSARYLCAVFCKDDGIDPANIVSHAEVAPGRKDDPRGFDMDTWRTEMKGYITNLT